MVIKLQDVAAESAAAVPPPGVGESEAMNPENLLWIVVNHNRRSLQSSEFFSLL